MFNLAKYVIPKLQYQFIKSKIKGGNWSYRSNKIDYEKNK